MIFDMDETLIHKVDSSDKCQDADVFLNIPFEDNSGFQKVNYFEYNYFSCPILLTYSFK